MLEGLGGMRDESLPTNLCSHVYPIRKDGLWIALLVIFSFITANITAVLPAYFTYTHAVVHFGPSTFTLCEPFRALGLIMALFRPWVTGHTEPLGYVPFSYILSLFPVPTALNV